mmetsp:Transcript_3278/g.10086  ORF Transcript_3278/g.10086 Transcript_3278/m.10086 type:complete len:199 (+) Transcript_3278:274-870(+)
MPVALAPARLPSAALPQDVGGILIDGGLVEVQVTPLGGVARCDKRDVVAAPGAPQPRETELTVFGVVDAVRAFDDGGDGLKGTGTTPRALCRAFRAWGLFACRDANEEADYARFIGEPRTRKSAEPAPPPPPPPPHASLSRWPGACQYDATARVQDRGRSPTLQFPNASGASCASASERRARARSTASPSSQRPSTSA